MKTILVLTFLLCSFLGFSQDKIEGIGNFKIGKTVTDDLERLSADYIFLYQELLPDSAETIKHGSFFTYPPFSTLCPEAQTFDIGLLSISNINLMNVHLTFYKDTLVSLVFDGSEEIVDAFKTKYGPGRVRKLDIGSSCGKKGIKMITTWFNNPMNGIVISSTESVKYNSKCQSIYYHSIHVGKTELNLQINDCDKVALEGLKKAETKYKKKALKDF